MATNEERDAGSGLPAQPSSEGFRSDEPLDDPAQDLFDRSGFARRLADTIRDRRDESSLVVGVFGPWGEGKTTVMNFIEDALANAAGGSDKGSPRITTVRFNPWLIGDEGQLLPAFFASVAAELNVSPGGKKRKLADRLSAYGEAFAGTSINVSPLGIDPAKTAEAVSRLLASSSLEQRRREFEDALRAANRRVVIFLDDIDRLETREVRAIFRLIRLAAPFERVTYVVACDDQAVASALRDVHGGDEASGDDFLEKIVQVPLHIPPASTESLRDLAFKGLDAILRESPGDLSGDDAREIGSRYIQGLEPGLRTPRNVKRFLNAVSFAKPMLGEEANIPDVIAVEGLRVAYPKTYRAIREHREWFLVSPPVFGDPDPENTRIRERLEFEVLTGLPRDEQSAVKYLLARLFPGVAAAFGQPQNLSRDEMYAARRVGHPDYFNRYFSYSVGTDGVAEREIRELLDAPTEQIQARILGLLETYGANVVWPLTRKVAVRLPLIKAETAKSLLDVLPVLGKAVTNKSRPDGLFARSAGDDLAVLITGLVDRLEAGERLGAAKSVLSSAQPLAFAMDAVRWLRQPPRPGADPMYDDDERTELGNQLAERIANSLEDDPLWNTEPQWPSLLSIAAKGPLGAQVRKQVARWLRSDPSSVDVLLSGVAGTMTSMETGQSRQDDFTTNSYDALVLLAPITAVRVAVRKGFGTIDASTYPPDATYVDDPAAAVRGQFAFLDAKRRREQRRERRGRGVL